MTADDSQPNCFDMQIGLTCDKAFERTNVILKSWNTPIIAPYVRNHMHADRFAQNSNGDFTNAHSLAIRTGLHANTAIDYIDNLFKYFKDMSEAGNGVVTIATISLINNNHPPQKSTRINGIGWRWLRQNARNMALPSRLSTVAIVDPCSESCKIPKQ